LHAPFVTGVFCFSADGTVAWGKHNVVGSWNDGEISRDFQERLMDNEINAADHGVLADSAFPVRADLFNRILTPLKEGDLERTPANHRGAVLALSNAITSLGQSAEWGMGAVEKVYRRLLVKLPYDKKIRKLRLLCIYRLYNFRVRSTHISQIRTYFLKMHFNHLNVLSTLIIT